MLDFSRVQNYYIACGYTDMRKQIDGLAALVQTQFGQEMDETSLYLFCGRRADRIKALYFLSCYHKQGIISIFLVVPFQAHCYSKHFNIGSIYFLSEIS